MTDAPDHLSRAQSLALGRRRRGRNLVLMGLLLVLVVLFFGISVIKLTTPDPHPSMTSEGLS